jgi:hypothetical protein
LILKSCVDARSKLSGNPLCRPVHSRAVFISAKRVAATLFRVAARSSVFRRFRIVGALAELVDNSFGPGRGAADTVTIIHDVTDRPRRQRPSPRADP